MLFHTHYRFFCKFHIVLHISAIKNLKYTSVQAWNNLFDLPPFKTASRQIFVPDKNHFCYKLIPDDVEFVFMEKKFWKPKKKWLKKNDPNLLNDSCVLLLYIFIYICKSIIHVCVCVCVCVRVYVCVCVNERMSYKSELVKYLQEKCKSQVDSQIPCFSFCI